MNTQACPWSLSRSTFCRVKQAVLVLLYVLTSLFVSREVWAHKARTAYLEIVAGSGESAAAIWKLPTPYADAWPEIEGCIVEEAGHNNHGSHSDSARESTFVHSLTVNCAHGVFGKTLRVRGLGPLVNEAVVRVADSAGQASSQVLSPSQNHWVIPNHTNFITTVQRHIRLGVEHIAEGTDHLVFLFGLFLLASSFRRVLALATSFTVGHSISLAASTFGLVTIAPAASEVAIALTLVLVALDIDKQHKNLATHQQSLSAELLLCAGFGLIHGLGFAGALAEVGLPATEQMGALVGFNLGVELGQIVLLTSLMIVAKMAQRMKIPSVYAVRAKAFGMYAVGSLGVFWILQRLPELLSSKMGG